MLLIGAVRHDRRVANRPKASVEVVPYSPRWAIQFEDERRALHAAMDGDVVSIEHIGSTAVPGLSAKPTIDILMVVAAREDFLDHLDAVTALGYDYRKENTFVGNETHLFLRKVGPSGQRTHHLHVVREGSEEIDDYRRFRDALRDDQELRDRYEVVKLQLAAKYADDRMRYVTSKADWVDGVAKALRDPGEHCE